MDFKGVSLDVDGAVAVMTLNRPEVLNAVDDAMLESMSDVTTPGMLQSSRVPVIPSATSDSYSASSSPSSSVSTSRLC